MESGVSWDVTSCILVYVCTDVSEKPATFVIWADLCFIQGKRPRYSLEMKVHGPQSHCGGVVTKVMFFLIQKYNPDSPVVIPVMLFVDAEVYITDMLNKERPA